MTLDVRHGVPLGPFTTIGIGGPARHFVRVQTIDELREALDWSRANGQPLFILGGGSNLLIADAGFPGLVVQLDLRGITIESVDRTAIVRVAASEPWDEFVARAVRSGWAGIECLSGIPGSTGATPIQNVGAYGQEVSESIIRVEVLDRSEGIVKTLTNWECRFGYRSSLFKNFERDRYVVTAVTFRLKIDGAGALRYPELRRYVESERIAETDLRGIRGAVIAIRKRKGMVIDPADPDTRSDGSFFMNPVVSASEHEALLGRIGEGERPAAFPDAEGNVKLSAAWLIENAGFEKGFTMGRAGLSTKHTLAIVNRGGASAAEVVALVSEIRARVAEKFGIELQAEPNFVGFG